MSPAFGQVASWLEHIEVQTGLFFPAVFMECDEYQDGAKSDHFSHQRCLVLSSNLKQMFFWRKNLIG